MGDLGTALPVSRQFRAHPSSLYQIRQFIREMAEASSLSAAMTDDLLLAVSEACVNAVIHTGSAMLRVTWRSERGCVEAQVEDEGIFRQRATEMGPEGEPGRGMLLMTAVMDEVTIREGTLSKPGTVVRFLRCER